MSLNIESEELHSKLLAMTNRQLVSYRWDNPGRQECYKMDEHQLLQLSGELASRLEIATRLVEERSNAT